jgi:UDP-2,3-diacylglucosamine pyrophosphatase LpxH
MPKRTVDIAIISDVHLGTRGCRARELIAYLDSITPKTLVLNGDILDLIQFKRRAWRPDHEAVLQRILGFARAGIPVHYLIGNHDAGLRGYSELRLENLHLADEIELDIAGARTWIHHGDRFDAELGTPGWMSTFGAWWYDRLVDVDCWHDHARAWCGVGRARQRVAVAAKGFFPQGIRHIARFEETCLRRAEERGVDQIVCGHIHLPRRRCEPVSGRTVTYFNSGDWVDNLTALESDGDGLRVVAFADLLARGLVAFPSVTPGTGDFAVASAMERISGRAANIAR